MNRVVRVLGRWTLKVYNFFIPREKHREDDDIQLTKIRQFARERTDINDHLETLYTKTLMVQPKVIVELGVRSGESSFALSRAAEGTGAWLISVDLEQTSFCSDYVKWRFVQADDIEFARNFPNFARETGFEPEIDFLFIDTSHTYDHTRAEIEAWTPYLAPAGTVAFHDTNLKRIFRRKDGSLGGGWNNRRGAIRAVQEFLGAEWNERRAYSGVHNGFSVEHFANCNGLTILRRNT